MASPAWKCISELHLPCLSLACLTCLTFAHRRTATLPGLLVMRVCGARDGLLTSLSAETTVPWSRRCRGSCRTSWALGITLTGLDEASALGTCSRPGAVLRRTPCGGGCLGAPPASPLQVASARSHRRRDSCPLVRPDLAQAAGVLRRSAAIWHAR